MTEWGWLLMFRIWLFWPPMQRFYLFQRGTLWMDDQIRTENGNKRN